MIINKSGITIRMSVEDLRVMGRATQGVKLINIKDSDSIAAVAKVMHEEEMKKNYLASEEGVLLMKIKKIITKIKNNNYRIKLNEDEN